jgi:hypothetical protein
MTRGKSKMSGVVKAAVISGVFAVFVAVIVGAFTLIEPGKEKSNTVIANGKNSVAIGSANNPTINQVQGNMIVNGVTHDDIQAIREGLKAIQKQKDAEISSIFDVGYILFTATERNEIVPLDSAFNEILHVDWKSGWNITFSEKAVTLTTPSMFITKNNLRAEFGPNQYTLDRVINPGFIPFVLGQDFTLGLKVVDTNADSITFALGILDGEAFQPSIYPALASVLSKLKSAAWVTVKSNNFSGGIFTFTPKGAECILSLKQNNTNAICWNEAKTLLDSLNAQEKPIVLKMIMEY